MKLRLLSAAVAVWAFAADGASAQEWSLSVLGGQSLYPSLTYDGGKADINQGFNAGFRLGYGLDEWIPISGFSLQADAFYNQSELSNQTKARFDSLSYMGNLIYRFDTGLPFGIYGGGGAGGVRTEIQDPLSVRNRTVLGWQAIGGLDYEIDQVATIFVEYRHQNTHDVNLRFIGGPVGNTSDNASVGIKFHLF